MRLIIGITVAYALLSCAGGSKQKDTRSKKHLKPTIPKMAKASYATRFATVPPTVMARFEAVLAALKKARGAVDVPALIDKQFPGSQNRRLAGCSLRGRGA